MEEGKLRTTATSTFQVGYQFATESPLRGVARGRKIGGPSHLALLQLGSRKALKFVHMRNKRKGRKIPGEAAYCHIGSWPIPLQQVFGIASVIGRPWAPADLLLIFSPFFSTEQEVFFGVTFCIQSLEAFHHLGIRYFSMVILSQAPQDGLIEYLRFNS